MSVRVATRDFDIELQLLIDAIYLKYHYDFRGYARSSLKRRLRTAMSRFGCETLSRLQDKVLHDASTFPALLGYLTVQVSEMFRDPNYFQALRARGAAAAHVSVAADLGRRLQHGRRGLFAGDSAA